MARFIPGGFEDYDDEDESDLDDLVYTNDPLKKPTLPADSVVMTTAATDSGSTSTQQNHTGGCKKGDLNGDGTDKKAFLWPPKPPDEFRRSQSPSREALVLDDIRLAVVKGNLGFVKAQVEADNGFFVDTVLKSGWTCLMYASNSGYPDIVHYLLENSADPNWHKDMFTPLMAVCSSTESEEDRLVQCAEHLIKFGAKVNAMDRYLNTPLMIASKNGKLQLAKLLVEHKANLNAQDNHGWTAVHWAAARGRGSVVRYLIEQNADLSVLNNSGQTASDVAYDNHFKEVGDILDRLKNQANSRKLSEAEEASLQKVRSDRSKIITNQVEPRQQKYVGDLEMFLAGLELSAYAQLFREHEITFRELLTFEEEDLDKMGITKLGVKRKMLEGIKNVHKADWKRSSLSNLKDKALISCPDAVSMMANINKHLAYIQTTIGYLRHQIKKNPKILEYGQEAANVENLLEETNECLANTRLLFDEDKFFGRDLKNLSEMAQLTQADGLDFDTELEKPETSSSLLAGTGYLVAGVATVATVAFLLKRYDAFNSWL